MTQLDFLEANKIYDSIMQTNKDLNESLADEETYNMAKTFIEERDVSDEIKKYALFLIEEEAVKEIKNI